MIRPSPEISEFCLVRPNRSVPCQLVAEDEETDIAIAASWNRRPHAPALETAACLSGRCTGAHHERLQEHLERYAIARKDRRLAALQQRWEQLKRIVPERAGDPAMVDVPGGSNGTPGSNLRAIPGGEPIAEYKFDRALVAAMLAAERQAAQESGHSNEKPSMMSQADMRRCVAISFQITRLPALSIAASLRQREPRHAQRIGAYSIHICLLSLDIRVVPLRPQRSSGVRLHISRNTG